MPGTTKVGILVNPSNVGSVDQLKELEAIAVKRGVSLTTVQVQVRDEIRPAFQRFEREHVQLALFTSDALYVAARKQIAAFALAARMATVSNLRKHVDAGGLISYGINLAANYHRAAHFVDRILKGTKPADLPIEFLPELELVINRSTAEALSIKIPPNLLLRANEIID